MRSALAVAFATVAGLVVACQGVADLDVKYTPEPITTNDGGLEAGVLGEGDAAPPRFTTTLAAAVPSILENCRGGPAGIDCDSAAGLGCCLSGGAVCLSNADYATACATGGVFVGCRQPTTDSLCCWSKRGGLTTALLAGVCHDGYACLDDSDCPVGQGTCSKITCHGVPIGQCGGPPTCP